MLLRIETRRGRQRCYVGHGDCLFAAGFWISAVSLFGLCTLLATSVFLAVIYRRMIVDVKRRGVRGSCSESVREAARRL